MEKETKKRKDGAEKEREKLKEIVAKCMNIQKHLQEQAPQRKAKRELIALCY